VARGSELDSHQDADSLVRDIEATRDRLAGTIDAIVDRTNPKNAARRTLERIKGRFIDADGSPRFENIVPVAGAAVGAVVLIVVVRRLLGPS
jgi:hypothetical protein